MGLGKSLKKAVKKVTKAVTKVVGSRVTAGIDAIKSVAKGDLTGVADAATRVASGGTISLKDKGLLNANLGIEQNVEAPPIQTEQPYDGLLAYVTDQRNRRAKRNRQSTNNTSGSNTVDGNKLSGTTALGV
ncbi:MAG: hypothetical protein IJ532_08135 [Alphaproteobacteria bacterium]|nr:hypothetical protein [Alphaproteobacteria bacterium]MBQ8482484.1 hypothetical protein [Alphaproteobacteria bacterium]